MDTAVVSVLVAGGVSLTVGGLSFLANRLSLRSERVKLEREMQRRLTEKLYDIRIDAYPEAFQITDKLRGDLLFRNEITEKYLMDVREELQDWYRRRASPFLSKASLEAFYAISNVLHKSPKSGPTFTRPEIDKVFHAKNDFRRRLRQDLNLLFDEEH